MAFLRDLTSYPRLHDATPPSEDWICASIFVLGQRGRGSRVGGVKGKGNYHPPRGEGAVLPPLAQSAPRHPLPPSRGLPPPLVAKARTVIPATASVM